MVNVMFVLFLVGLLYAWMRSVRMREAVIMKPGLETVLEKTAVGSAYPAGCSDDRYVPVYEFLGFYYLFRGDRWSGAVYQYRSV